MHIKWPFHKEQEQKQIEYQPEPQIIQPEAVIPPETKRTVTCSICGQTGHNSRKCPNKPAETIPPETPPDIPTE